MTGSEEVYLYYQDKDGSDCFTVENVKSKNVDPSQLRERFAPTPQAFAEKTGRYPQRTIGEGEVFALPSTE